MGFDEKSYEIKSEDVSVVMDEAEREVNLAGDTVFSTLNIDPSENPNKNDPNTPDRDDSNTPGGNDPNTPGGNGPINDECIYN